MKEGTARKIGSWLSRSGATLVAVAGVWLLRCVATNNLKYSTELLGAVLLFGCAVAYWIACLFWVMVRTGVKMDIYIGMEKDEE